MAEFKGWVSRSYIPHFDTSEVVQSITFRLADSLPAEVTARRGAAGAEVDAVLDAGLGRCLLRNPDLADVVERALLRFDGDRYHLLAWVVMPNHVHVVVRPAVPLAELMHSWKSYTAKAINRHLGETGTVWQPDYFDRFIRDEAHLSAAIAYVESNPVKAGLCGVAKDWRWSSAYWRG